MPSRDDIRSLTTERRWIPPSTLRRDALTPEGRNDLIFRKVRGILNKLTPEKFGKLSNDLLNIELKSDVILKGVIFLIFEKALDEPKYSFMYAQLCKRLSEEAPTIETNNEEKKSTFSDLLLKTCKIEFENRSRACEEYENQDELDPEAEERRQVAKRKMLGNIKFMGELGKLRIVTDCILHKCIQQLLMDRRRAKSRAEDIECLCQIMRTCGHTLDTDKGKWLMEQYFERMNMLSKCSKLPMRIRFMLRDVIELRHDNWQPRKAISTEGPMPIKFIKTENDNDSRSSNYHRHASNQNDRLGNDLFKRMSRVNLDDPMVGSIPLTSPSFGMPSSFNPNGFASPPASVTGVQSVTGVPFGRHNQRNQSSYYSNSNRHQNNYQSKHNQQQHNSPQNFNNGNKEQLRFNKNKMLTGPPEEVSLRPAANSMVFKQTNINPNLPLNNDIFPSRLTESTLLRATSLKTTAPILQKEAPPAIVIKQGPLDKRDKARERKDKGPTKEELLEKVVSLMDDAASHNNVQDAVTAFKELKIPERFLRHAVFKIYYTSLDRNDSDRDLAAKIITQLKKDSLINSQQYSDGWKELVSSIPEKEATVPRVMSHVAFLTSRAIMNNLMQLSDLASVTENGQHYPLFLLTLQQLHKSQGKQVLTQIFNESKVNLMSQLPEAEKTKDRLGEILEDRDLTFLYPLLRIQGDMWRQLESDPNPKSFYLWIKEKLDPSHHSDPGFINALMSVLLKYITQETTFPQGANPSVQPEKGLIEKESAMLQKYQPMLQTLLPSIDSQVTALHSLQVFCLSHKFPKGMLLRWFMSLYELSIIDEEALMKWKEDVNDAYPGKGQALFQVNTWLTWLAEQSSDEEDDEDDDKADN